MVISIGEGVLVNTENIIAILDMDSITVKERGKIIFNLAQDKMVYIDEESLPRSCIIVCENGKTTLYISPLNSVTISKRAADSDIKKGNFF